MIQRDKLSVKEIKKIEVFFGFIFPESTSVIKVFYNGDGYLYCFLEFATKDCNKFKSEHKWIKTDQKDIDDYLSERIPFYENESTYVVVKNLFSPWRSVKILGIGYAEHLKWWTPSGKNVEWVHSSPSPYGSGGRIDILLEKQNEKIRAYMVYVGMRYTFPSEIKQIFRIKKGRGNVRQSNPFPMKDGNN